MTDIDLIKQALEYLEDNQHHIADNERHAYVMLYNDVITTLKERLAQDKALQALHNENKRLSLYEDAYAEPVAWGVFEGNLHDMFFTQSEAQEMAKLKGTHAEVRPFYTHPPQRTEPPQKKVWTFWDLSGGDITDAIKAKLKEKNT